ncbi:MAG: nitroreductase family protein, partial [Microbacterium sp.]
VADHSSMRPWRLIELRGDDRVRLGEAIAQAENDKSPSTKPLRAPLLIAVVASYGKSDKVPRWEQEAVASGVAHVLSLLLDEAGWGVIWRTGRYTRSKVVAKAHGLEKNEELLGWLYIGGKPPRSRLGRRKGVEARRHVSRMPRPAPQDKPSKPDSKSKNTAKSMKKKKKSKSGAQAQAD